MTTLWRVLIFAAMLCATFSWAGEPLTWQQCVAMAARHNPALAAVRFQAEAAAAGVGVARSALLPQVSAGLSANRGSRSSSVGGNSLAGGETTAGGQGGTTYNGSVSIEQSLYSGGKNEAALSVARASLAQTDANATGKMTQLTHDLRVAFINLLYAQEQVTLLRTIAQRRQDNLELVDLRYEGGREHKGSLALSRASLFDAQMQLTQAERLVCVNSRFLSRTIGFGDNSSNLVVTGAMTTGELPAASDVDALLRVTPSYNASVAAIRVATAQVDSACSSRRPDISMTGTGGRTGGENTSDDNEWSVGVKLSLAIWDGGQTAHSIRKAKAGLAEAEANLADTENSLARDLTDSHQALANAEENVAVQAKYVEAAEIRAEIARQQYKDGLLTFENWSLIEDDLIGKRKQLVDARRNAMSAEASWWLATGREVFSDAKEEARGEI
jgi:outer membrane protein TolC